jgi:ABC-type multidrug transport system fused ATPase/permease subunit
MSIWISKNKTKQKSDTIENFARKIQESFSLIRTIRSFGREHVQQQRYQEYATRSSFFFFFFFFFFFSFFFFCFRLCTMVCELLRWMRGATCTVLCCGLWTDGHLIG